VPESEWNSASIVVDPAGIGPRILFERVPAPKHGKNRVHLDLNVNGGPTVPVETRRERVDREVARLAELGATKQRTHDEVSGFWVVTHDPAGNEFCVQ